MRNEAMEREEPKRPVVQRVRTGGRSARVVESVLEAALQQLAIDGYARFSMEAVSERAGVHKSTIYRRWPTKQQLLHEALAHAMRGRTATPDTGSVREDLIATVLQMAEGAATPLGRSLMMTLQVEATNPELREIGRAIREQNDTSTREVLRRGILRGELAPATDLTLITDVLTGTLQKRLFFDELPAFRDYAARLIDLLLEGARAPSAVRR